jgi:radical SAM protein with 4Fe4S-binding SPASM domain
MKNFAIDPYGHLSTCVLSWVESFDLRKGGFQEGWDIFLRKVRGRKITRRTKCTACQLIALCGMCPANAYLENQDPETPVDFLCQVAHLRAQALGIPVKPHGGCEYCRRTEQ